MAGLGEIFWLRYFLPLPCSYPIYLLFFITARCMGRCRHCFYWKELNQPKKELSLDEIEKLSKSIGRLLQLTITGGEPLLRDDLEQVFAIFYQHNKPFDFGLATSGFYPEKLEKLARWVLENLKESNFTIGLPIEGLPELNDWIRGVDGFFERTRESILRLRKLKEKFPQLTILVDITASAYNQDQLEETYYMVRDELAPDLINLIIVRGEPKEKEAKELDPQKIRQAVKLIEEEARRRKIAGYKFYSRLLLAKDNLLRRVALEVFEGKSPRLRCQAGRLIGVIYPEGEVYPCELLDKPMGSLREAGYDLKKIWHSQKAAEIRRWIRKEKCRCYHQCFLSPSLFFDPLYLPSLIKEYLTISR